MPEFIDARTMKLMFLGGAKQLEAKKAWINELNVFPVPDGDTGTNMTLTLMSAAKEVAAIQSGSIADMCSKISMGTLRGARGNSGVIMSQLCRGFAKIASQADRIDKITLANAMEHATLTAYKAVQKPKEGTILTVAKGVSSKAKELVDSDLTMEAYLQEILKYAEFVLSKTPTMLPVLAEAGVVDSGGQGLVEFIRGAVDVFMGKQVEWSQVAADEGAAAHVHGAMSSANISTADIKFGYCTEFIIMAEKEFGSKEEKELKKFLSDIGDSLVVVVMDGIVKVHVHTNHPGQAFEKGLTYGQLTSMKVDNLHEEHNEKVIKEAEKAAAAKNEAAEGPAGDNINISLNQVNASVTPMYEAAVEIQMQGYAAGISAAGVAEYAGIPAAGNKNDVPERKEPSKEYGTVAVCVGDGLAEIYRELGADEIIEGGQTMNPSTEDIIAAIDKVNAKNVFIFPNNGNIIMAANQAAQLYEDKNIYIVPTKTVVQGISALISFDASASADDNLNSMKEAAGLVKSGEVTYAVRDTEIDGKKINKGDFMGIGDSGILAVEKELEETVIETIKAMVDDNTSMVTFYVGADATEDAAEGIVSQLSKEYAGIEFSVVVGGQPVYYYFISVE